MKREIRREVRLTSFSIGIPELALLWTRLDPLFAYGEQTSFYVDIEFDEEKLTVESLEELNSAVFPVAKSTDFTLHCHGAGQSLHLYAGPHAGYQPKLIITSDSEVWLAGAKEVVLTVVNQNRVWHHWLRPRLLGGLFLLGMVVSVIGIAYLQARNLEIGRPLVAGIAGTLLALGWLSVARTRLLPMATLRLSAHEAFWRRYFVELTLALALLSALLTAYGIFGPKTGT